jgi:hypothetical protein
LKRIDEEMLDALLDAGIEWERVGRHTLKGKIRDLIAEVDEAWARRKRRNYLIGRKWDLQLDIDTVGIAAELALKGNRVVIARYRLEQIKELKERVAKLESDISFLAKDPAKFNRENQITEDVIQRAKEVDFRTLHEFDSRGWGRCPFHEDKNPSFHIHTPSNRVKCWSGACNWQGDTIQFVMEREGLTFHEAVRRLAG